MPKADWWQVTEACTHCTHYYKSAYPTFELARKSVVASIKLRSHWATALRMKLHPVRYKIKGITNGKR